MDVDIAGDQRIGRGLTPDLRIMKGQSDWPSMHVRYTLTEKGHIIMSGEEHLPDLSYLQRSNRHVKDDSLRYERQMVDDWFRERLGVKC